MVAEGDGRIVRDFKWRQDRRTIVRIGNVTIEFVPVTKNGKEVIEAELPKGSKIEHIDLTEGSQSS